MSPGPLDWLVAMPALLLVGSAVWMAAKLIGGASRKLGAIARRLRDRKAAAFAAREGERLEREEKLKQEQNEADAAEEERRKAGQLRGDKRAPRRAARRYFEANEELVRDEFTREMFDAYMHVDMAEQKEPQELWTAHRALVERLHPLIVAARNREVEEQERRRRRAEQARGFDDEIAELQAEIERLQTRQGEPDVIADEIQGLVAEIERVTQRRETFLAEEL